jgi:hypothetical protein
VKPSAKPVTPEPEQVIVIGASMAVPEAELIPGSRKYNCEKCGSSIWLAPSGQKAVGNGATVLCIPCATAEPLKPGDDVALPPGAIGELRAWARRQKQ